MSYASTKREGEYEGVRQFLVATDGLNGNGLFKTVRQLLAIAERGKKSSNHHLVALGDGICRAYNEWRNQGTNGGDYDTWLDDIAA